MSAVIDPVSSLFGKDSTIARINKTIVDPGGVTHKSENIFGKGSAKLFDPLGYGDAAKKNTTSSDTGKGSSLLGG